MVAALIVDDQIADFGPETISSNLEDKMKLARATGQTTYSQHDLGITTEISISAKDFSGKKNQSRCRKSNAQSQKVATKSKSFITKRKKI